MADYRITFARSAGKELHQLNPPVAQRVFAAIQRLAANPRPPGCVKLTGSENDWRIRIGDWRVIYSVFDTRRVVDIAAIRHRSDAYR
jgi:mRNA interferase RelE/StbE